jgi:hypothetical protein
LKILTEIKKKELKMYLRTEQQREKKMSESGGGGSEQKWYI